MNTYSNIYKLWCVKIVFIIITAWCGFSAKAQNSTFFHSSNIVVHSNLDSLNSVAKQQNSPKTLLHTLFCIEFLQSKNYSYLFGEHLQTIDSLCKIVNDNSATALYKLLYVKKFPGKNKDIAFKYLNAALEQFIKTGDTVCIGNCYLNLMNFNIVEVPNLLDTKKNVDDYYNKLMDYVGNSKNVQCKLIKCFANCIYNAEILKNNNKLLQELHNGLLICNEDESFKGAKLFFCLGLGNTYLLLNDEQKANEYYNLALSMPIVKQSIVYACIKIAKADDLVAKHNYAAAKSIYEDVLKNIDVKYFDSDVTLLKMFFEGLAKANYKLGLYQLAADNLFRLDSLSQKIDEVARHNYFLDLQTKYETKSKENTIHNLELSKKNYATVAIVVISILLVFVILLGFIYYQNRRLTQLNNFKNKVHSIISHDLRSPIYGMLGLSKKANYLIRKKDFETLNEVSNKIDENVNKIINLLNNLLTWALVRNKKLQVENFNATESVLGVISFYQDILEAKHIVVKQNLPFDLCICSNKYVFELIVRNWVDNITKYAAATSINFSATTSSQNQVVITIANDGLIKEKDVNKIQQILLSKSKINIDNTTGLGLGLIAYFAKQEKIDIKYTYSNNESVFEIVIKGC